MDWRPVQVVPHPSPNDNWDRLQPPCDPELDYAGIENGWMNGWLGLKHFTIHVSQFL